MHVLALEKDSLITGRGDRAERADRGERGERGERGDVADLNDPTLRRTIRATR